jgi:hypothetical protein
VHETFGKFKAAGCSDSQFEETRDHWVNVKAEGKSIEQIQAQIRSIVESYKKNEFEATSLESIQSALFKDL